MSAKKIFLWVLLTSLSYVSCKNTDSGNNKHDEVSNTLKKAWYKHFSGTKDGQNVVVDLQCSVKMVRGSYYYIDKGMVIDLLPPDQSKVDMNNITFIESDSEERPNDDDSAAKTTWQLSLQDAKASGKWLSGDKKRSGSIELKEDYPTGTYPLDVIIKGDSKEERKDVAHVTAATFYELLQPAAQMNKADADFLHTAILHFLGGEFADALNINDYVLQEDKKYFDNFEKLLADMNIDREAHEDWQYNFEYKRRLDVRYNNNGMLVLQLAVSERTGGSIMGSHFRDSYACIDVQQKKLWQLKDVMNADHAILTPLLNDEVRKVFGIPSGPLSGKLRVDDVPLTDNIYITGTGIAFCYFPGVIAPEDDGEICLFIPFTKLKSWLKEDFKNRMKL